MPVEPKLSIVVLGDRQLAQIALKGRLVSETRFELERIIRDWMEHEVQHIVVDCSELKYIDSAGLSTLIGALHRLRRRGGNLGLASLNPSLGSVFELTSMSKYFTIFPTTAAAAEHFGVAPIVQMEPIEIIEPIATNEIIKPSEPAAVIESPQA